MQNFKPNKREYHLSNVTSRGPGGSRVRGERGSEKMNASTRDENVMNSRKKITFRMHDDFLVYEMLRMK